jgi:hypothetical protein
VSPTTTFTPAVQRSDALCRDIKILNGHNHMIYREHSPMMFEQTLLYKQQYMHSGSLRRVVLAVDY